MTIERETRAGHVTSTPGPLDQTTAMVCVVPGCEWDAARGTAGGAPEPKCGGWTCPREGAFAWVTGSDPEDLESYAEHVRIVTTR